MRVYIDRPNIISFFRASGHALFGDCLRMLKSQADIWFNFPKSNLLSDEALQIVVTQLASGSKDAPRPKFAEDSFPTRPLKSNMHIDISNRDDLTAVYLITDEKVKSVQQKGYILIGDEGQEIETLSELFFDDFQFSKSLTPKKDMPNWYSLTPTIKPCTDIIITDRYMFSNEELLEYNLHAYLSVLGGDFPGKKVNIVLFTCLKQQYKSSDGRTQFFTPDWNKLKSELKGSLKRKYGASPNVTIVPLMRVDEHDRTIFTNYNNSYSGDSLTYYDSKWNHITKGRHYAIHSHGLRENLENGYLFIEDMQSVLNSLSAKEKENIVGDKKCGFLKFSE